MLFGRTASSTSWSSNCGVASSHHSKPSRYWPVEGWAEAAKRGANPPSYDKQFVRDWLEQARMGGQPWNKTAPAPALPADVIERTAAKYREAFARLRSS